MAMTSVSPRKLFPSAFEDLTAADWRHCSDLWAERFLVNKAAGNHEAADECRHASEFCLSRAEQMEAQ